MPVGTPLLFLLMWARERLTLPPAQTLLGAQACLLLFTVFIFPLPVWACGLAASIVLIVADLVIYQVAYAVSSLATGLALQYAMQPPGGTSWLTAENFLLLRELLENSLGRFVAPPLGRLLIQTGGRVLYAVAQLSLCAVTLACIYCQYNPGIRLLLLTGGAPRAHA